ncbi:transmembrane protein 222 isoform X2 [Lagopus leucura]|nr:transmembrane protein 222 isoform X2 [Lagopus leucura]
MPSEMLLGTALCGEMSENGREQKVQVYPRTASSGCDPFTWEHRAGKARSLSALWKSQPWVCLSGQHGSRWLFPIIGHMGICTSTGVIRDFAGPYFVSEDNMAFGKPVKYWKLDPGKVYSSSPNAWDTAVHDASEEYKHRMHNLCCDNCHSHVALALNLMRYDNSTSWNMVKLCFFSLLYGKYVSIGGFVKTWLPFVLFLGAILTVVLTLHLR